MMQGIELYNLALKHIGEPYILGSLVPKDDPDYKGPWDCAEFVTWLVYQVSHKLYGCANNNGDPRNADSYTGFWGRDAKKLGQIIKVNEAAQIPGAAILRLAGNGLVGHIVVSNGKGGTAEAHSHKDGVIKSVVAGRRWDIGILVPWIEYEQIGITTHEFQQPTEKIYRFMHPLMKGYEIKTIQTALNTFGFHIVEDGVFGQQTFNSVKAFQYKRGLVPDGEVGPKTLKVLGLNFY